MIIDAVLCCVLFYTFSVYLLHYAYIVIVITVLVTTRFLLFFALYSVQSTARASEWLIERNSWFVAKKVKVCMSIYLNWWFRATRTCNVSIHTKNRGARDSTLFIYLYHHHFAGFACEYHQPVFDNYRSIFDAATQEDTQKQTTAHSHRIIYYYCTHSISMLFQLLKFFAWRIYCHHWNFIFSPLWQWLFNSTNVGFLLPVLSL